LRFVRNQAFHFAHDVIMSNQFTTISGFYAFGNFFNLLSVLLKVFFDSFVH